MSLQPDDHNNFNFDDMQKSNDTLDPTFGTSASDRSNPWRVLLYIIIGIGLVIYLLIHLAVSAISHARLSRPLVFTRDVPLHNSAGAFPSSAEAETQNTNLLRPEKLMSMPFAMKVVAPADLSGMTRDQVVQKRVYAMSLLSQGMENGYAPYPPIFSGIEDRKPWWSIDGITLYGAGTRAIQGMSYRSNSLLNPLALIWPNVWDYTFPVNGMIDLSHVIVNGKIDPAFPYLPRPKNILVDPEKQQISMHIYVADYNKAVAPYMVSPLKGQILVQFEGVNARDLGYPFIALDAGQSTHLTKANPGELAVQDMEYYHTGGSCGYPGGCNNLSPKTNALSDYAITQLPAKAQFKLWHHKPASVSDKADIVYTIYFD